MHFFGCLLIGLFFLLIFAIALIGSVIDRILVFLGLRKPRKPFGQFSARPDEAPQWDDPQKDNGNGRKQQKHQGKIFEKDESEYVDFEEV